MWRSLNFGKEATEDIYYHRACFAAGSLPLGTALDHLSSELGATLLVNSHTVAIWAVTPLTPRP